jgi:hypothetical protein
LLRTIGHTLTCASDFASTYGIAGGLKALGIGRRGASGFIIDALGGTAFSGITDLGASILTGSGGGNNPFYNMGQSALNGPMLGLPATGALKGTAWGGSATEQTSRGIASAAFAAITGVGQSLQTLNGSHSLASTALTAGEAATTALNWKLAYDFATYGGGLAGCAVGLIH